MTIEHAEAEIPGALNPWEALTRDADEIQGGDLEKGDILVGVPFCATEATFRRGDYKNAKTGEVGWYVSLRIVVAPQGDLNRAIRRGRIPEENRDVLPEAGEALIFNEGGTGVYRQVVEYLCAKGYIRIESDLPEMGAYGESKYDILPPQWEYPEVGNHELRFDNDGLPVVSFNIRLLCPRGLRLSEYENEYSKTGKTRYFA